MALERHLGKKVFQIVGRLESGSLLTTRASIVENHGPDPPNDGPGPNGDGQVRVASNRGDNFSHACSLYPRPRSCVNLRTRGPCMYVIAFRSYSLSLDVRSEGVSHQGSKRQVSPNYGVEPHPRRLQCGFTTPLHLRVRDSILLATRSRNRLSHL